MRSATTAIIALVAAFTASLVLMPQHTGAQSVSASAEPVFVELFTSQGCSSCPPADRLAQKLDSDEGVVVISRPVTYWDRLGWKDTLASEDNTDLQHAYARRGLDGYNGVYTPQSVVAGRMGEVGSREIALRQLIAEARQFRQAVIRVRGDAQRGYAVGLAGETDIPAELILMGVSRRPEVAIARGENRGRRIAYTNVLRSERKLSGWTGGKASLVIDPAMLTMEGADRYAIILREPDAGRVLAARWLN